MNETYARNLFDRLRRMNELVKNGQPVKLPVGAVSKLDEIEARLLEAMRRDAIGGPERDGFPSGNVGDGGELAPQSSTEAAAWGNLGDTRRDPHHDLTAAACAHLEAVDDSLRRLVKALDQVDDLATIPRRDPAGWCQCCGRWVEGTANDRLKSGYCEADYKAWDRASRPDRAAFERRRRAEAAA